MKHTGLYTFSLALLVLAGCSREERLFENKVFIAADSFKNEVRVAVDEDIKTMERSISVAVAQPEDRDIEVSFVEKPEYLETYRQAFYDEEAELLPAANYDLGDLKALIRKGAVKSDPVSFSFTNLGKENLDYTKSYVLPVSIVCDALPVLERSKTMYFVIKKASLVNVVADMNTNMAWPEWGSFEQVKNLRKFTMEALINFHAFNNKSKIHTIMGVEDCFLIRVGDVTIPTNQIQVAAAYRDEEGNSIYRKDVTSAALQLKTDRWYHLAVTFDEGQIKVYLDGKEKASGSVNPIANRPNPDVEGGLEAVRFDAVNMMVPHSDESDGKPRCFWIGYSYDKDRSLDGMITEARVWNKVLTEEEINAPGHYYKLYDFEKDPSLLAYWKFNEGTGKNVKDYSMYGNDLTGDHDFVWYPVSLPQE